MLSAAWRGFRVLRLQTLKHCAPPPPTPAPLTPPATGLSHVLLGVGLSVGTGAASHPEAKWELTDFANSPSRQHCFWITACTSL